MTRLVRCPHCGGTDLDYEAGHFTGQKYHCKSCDYVGPFVIEVDLEDEVRRATEGKDR